MRNITNIIRLVEVIRQFHEGRESLSKSIKNAKEIFHSAKEIFDEKLFNTAFPVIVDYFVDPAKLSKEIMREKVISRNKLIAIHHLIRNSNLLRSMFLSSYYPRSLLIRAAVNFLEFLKQKPSYIHKILNRELVGPMQLEIHPTVGKCVYRCQMCIWCGGKNKTFSLEEFYKGEKLLDASQWQMILEEAKNLGTQQIIFSGGGETLIAQDKINLVLERANFFGFKTMIYSNGRLLYKISHGLLNSILNSTWLRISMHAARPEIYSKLINRPTGAGDLKFVLKGIRTVIESKRARGKNLKVGIGIVLQNLNYAEIPDLTKLCSELEVDFLDIRVDCAGITKKLTKLQKDEMLEDLKELRDKVEKGLINFNVSFADDLLVQMDQWSNFKLTTPKRCFIPLIRPAIDPFGIVGACDIIGEPYTRSISPKDYILGKVDNANSLTEIIKNASYKDLEVSCQFCMPGQVSLNAFFGKLINDYQDGIEFYSQPFNFIND